MAKDVEVGSWQAQHQDTGGHAADAKVIFVGHVPDARQQQLVGVTRFRLL